MSIFKTCPTSFYVGDSPCNFQNEILKKMATLIVEVKTKRQINFPFSEITTQNNENKSFFGRENREIWCLVLTATI